MTSIKQEANILKYRKNRHLNIGIVIFGIIFIYLVATIIMYLMAPHISVYEVRQGSILKDNAYTGLAVRKENVYYSNDSGYINYYTENNSKVRVGSRIYTLTQDKIELEDSVANVELDLTNEELHSLTTKIQSYNEQFFANDFSATYRFKHELQNTLNGIANQSKNEQLDHISGLTFQTASKDGIVVYSIDGMETVTVEDFDITQLDKSNYTKNELTNNSQVVSGEPIYKIVTDDNWQLLVKITDETKAALNEKTSVKVHFKKDNEEIRAGLTLMEKEGATVACLSFEDSMIRYVNDRYLDIELILEDETGLKIPKSAETSKEFYIVPKTYLTQGGNSSTEGVMKQTTDSDGKVITEFLPVTIYYEEDETVYLDPVVFDKGDVLLKPDSAETYPLQETKSLKGVFCINKGYAVFKQIQILCESGEYYIIEEGNDFGLSNYDHIALDGTSIKENDVVF